jgi:hypothetical protein
MSVGASGTETTEEESRPRELHPLYREATIRDAFQPCPQYKVTTPKENSNLSTYRA